MLVGAWFLTHLGLGCPKACVDLLVGRARAQLVPEQGLAYWWAGWAHRLWDYGFLASGICPLVVGAAPEGFLEGRARAQVILGLVCAAGGWSWILGPLVGRAMSRGGSCGLRRS